MKYIVIAVLFLFVSCKSYQIDAFNLKSQLEQTKAISEDNPENIEKNTYVGENLSRIKVINSKDKEVILDTENPIVLKVTRKDGFKFKYYLSSMSVNGNTFRGMGPTYLVGGMIHKVHVDSIASIKVKP